MRPKGGDGAYYRDDIQQIRHVQFRSGTASESGETHVIMDMTLQTGESYSYALPAAFAKELAEMLQRLAEGLEG